MLNSIFVYGTLQRGYQRAPMWPRPPRQVERATIQGRMHDLGIYPALVDAGYRPFRIDREEHNDRIDDRILSEIRRSGLLIADFTGHRAGVYFEAGFAKGLGLPVIWTVREEELKDTHFDTRQYNHVTWTSPTELREKLFNRVTASLERAPRRV